MLARLALLLIAVPAVALAQGASAPTASNTVAASTPAPPSQPPASAPVQPRLASAPPSPPADPARCRVGCAQTNYFCNAGEHAEGCGGSWSQCVAACDLPGMASDVSTAP